MQKNIPKKSNSFNLSFRIPFPPQFLLSWQHRAGLLPHGNITFQWHSEHSCGILCCTSLQTQRSEMTDPSFWKCENDLEQKTEWRETEAQVNPCTKATFSHWFLILHARGKNKVLGPSIASKPQGAQRLQLKRRTSKKHVKSITSLEGDQRPCLHSSPFAEESI